jgi:hypothetical protein
MTVGGRATSASVWGTARGCAGGGGGAVQADPHVAARRARDHRRPVRRPMRRGAPPRERLWSTGGVVTWLVEEGGGDLDDSALITVPEKPRVVST